MTAPSRPCAWASRTSLLRSLWAALVMAVQGDELDECRLDHFTDQKLLRRRLVLLVRRVSDVSLFLRRRLKLWVALEASSCVFFFFLPLSHEKLHSGKRVCYLRRGQPRDRRSLWGHCGEFCVFFSPSFSLVFSPRNVRNRKEEDGDRLTAVLARHTRARCAIWAAGSVASGTNLGQEALVGSPAAQLRLLLRRL